jgi:hypothetical protein
LSLGREKVRQELKDMRARHGPSFFPIVALLIVGLIVFYPAFKKSPPVEELLHATSKISVERPTIKVWVNKGAGLYYCPQSEFYGRAKPGFYMAQHEAVQSGYRPAAHQACK